ncbi:MAG: EamA family transporter, partial [Desulfurococcales archaeon]|nr:EamA family transporter [Desulfurococcales archaeon]
RGFDASLFLALSYASATVILLPFSVKEGFTVRDLYCGLTSGLLVAVGSYGSYKAVENLGGVAAFPLVNLAYLIPVIYGVVFLGEPVYLPVAIGFGLVAVSIILFSGAPRRFTLRGVLWLLVGFTGFGFTDVVLKIYGETGGNMVSLSFLLNFFVTIYMSFQLFRKRDPSIVRGNWRIVLLLSLANGFLLGLSTFYLLRAFECGPVSRVSPIVKLNTVIPVSYSVLRGERPDLYTISGAATAVVAVVLLSL